MASIFSRLVRQSSLYALLNLALKLSGLILVPRDRRDAGDPLNFRLVGRSQVPVAPRRRGPSKDRPGSGPCGIGGLFSMVVEH